MSDTDLKKIHGDDVELAPDDSEHDKRTPAEALAEAKAEGYTFVDRYHIRSDLHTAVLDEETQLPLSFTSKSTATKQLNKLDSDGKLGYIIVETRNAVEPPTLESEQS